LPYSPYIHLTRSKAWHIQHIAYAC
jgi:hypothetical protein